MSGAFHTPFMADARDRLTQRWPATDLSDAETPVLANVDALPHTDAADWRALMAAQLCTPVRWRQTIHHLADSGVNTFVELGPGNVLTGMVKRTLQTASRSRLRPGRSRRPASDRLVTPSAIIGWGGALPDRVVTNHDLEQTLDTSDRWITERTGIRERRIGGSTTSLAHEAASRALEAGDIDPESIDLLVLATCTPDQIMPASGPTLQDLLGLRCGAFDVNAACSGFVYALGSAYGFLETGMDRVLVVGSDTMSAHHRLGRPHHRHPLCRRRGGHGAGAAQRGSTAACWRWTSAAEGASRHILYTDHGGKIVMKGHEVFRQAVRAVVGSVEAALAHSEPASPSDIALVIPHQANYRIVDAVAARMGLDDVQVRQPSWIAPATPRPGASPWRSLEAADAGRALRRRSGAVRRLRGRHVVGHRHREVPTMSRTVVDHRRHPGHRPGHGASHGRRRPSRRRHGPQPPPSQPLPDGVIFHAGRHDRR